MPRPSPALSELSVTEFLTLSRAGFLPHGLVVGSCVYAAGTEYDWVVRTGEVDMLSTALREARMTSIARMRAQAAEVGAEGVVDVRVEVSHDVWRGARRVAKFVAIGTAIGFDQEHAPPHVRHAPSLRLASGAPFTSDLTATDFAALLRAGYRPVDLAMGVCIYGLDPREMRDRRDADVELSGYTQAFFDARELAMERLQQDLFAAHPRGTPDEPVGVVGMTVKESVYGSGLSAPMVEFSAIGTAVAPLASDDPRRSPEHLRPTLVMSLDR
jgi:uncharacterized protein YbjQ (UPF0145 family)